MIKTIIKRSGEREDFDAKKLNGWGQWAAERCGTSVDWTGVVLDAIKNLPEVCSSQDLQKALIDACKNQNTWSYSLMAGRLYSQFMHKQVFPDGNPTILQLHRTLVDQDIMRRLDYSEKEYALLQEHFLVDADMSYPVFQQESIYSKYCLQDRVTGELKETPQFVYMRVAMAAMETRPKKRRFDDVVKLYKMMSKGQINVQTPYCVNFGTQLRGYASCCLVMAGDTAPSIAAHNLIANTMTYNSAGIGSHMAVRSLNDPIHGGLIKHQGKIPYYRALTGEVRACLQNSRTGACTTYFSIYDPEIMDLLMLKNPMSTEAKRIRGIDYNFCFNEFFVRKAAQDEEIFLFNVFTAPRLYELLFSGDELAFENEYDRLSLDPSFSKTYVRARDILVLALQQRSETGRMYSFNATAVNTHTPFKDTIWQSNLCVETVLPTSPFLSAETLYKADPQGPQEGEIALCALAGINVDRVSESEYEEVAYYALLLINQAILTSEYPFPHLNRTAHARMSAGVGIMGLATLMAREHYRYDDLAGKQFIHRVAERHLFYLIKASIELGRELGVAPWMDRTKWVDGWLPIDTPNKFVDSRTDHIGLSRDWESLRTLMIESGGMRFSTVAAHMPGESSSKASGSTNGVYPVRQTRIIKTGQSGVIEWIAPYSDNKDYRYQSAWDVPTKDMTDVYAIIQKFTDQSISADYYQKVDKGEKISAVEMIKDFLYTVKAGIKTTYYLNSMTTSVKQDEVDTDDADDVSGDAQCEGCSL